MPLKVLNTSATVLLGFSRSSLQTLTLYSHDWGCTVYTRINVGTGRSYWSSGECSGKFEKEKFTFCSNFLHLFVIFEQYFPLLTLKKNFWIDQQNTIFLIWVSIGTWPNSSSKQAPIYGTVEIVRAALPCNTATSKDTACDVKENTQRSNKRKYPCGTTRCRRRRIPCHQRSHPQRRKGSSYISELSDDDLVLRKGKDQQPNVCRSLVAESWGCSYLDCGNNDNDGLWSDKQTFYGIEVQLAIVPESSLESTSVM